MKPWRPTRLALLALAGLGLILAVAALLPGGLELRITGLAQSGQTLLAAPLEPGERFTLYYHHSVNRLPIWEEHAADARGRIFVEQERFVSFNAGMGHLPGQGRHTARGGYQVIDNLHRPVGDFVLRVGSPGVGHTILWRGTSSNLSTLAAGRAVRIRARPVSLLYRWWRCLRPHPRTPRSLSQ